MPRRREKGVCLEDWQLTLMDLLKCTCDLGMPCHKVYNGRSFQEMQRRAANAELAILAIHGAIADVTDFVSNPNWSQRDSAEAFIHRNNCDVLRKRPANSTLFVCTAFAFEFSSFSDGPAVLGV